MMNIFRKKKDFLSVLKEKDKASSNHPKMSVKEIKERIRVGIESLLLVHGFHRSKSDKDSWVNECFDGVLQCVNLVYLNKDSELVIHSGVRLGFQVIAYERLWATIAGSVNPDFAYKDNLISVGTNLVGLLPEAQRPQFRENWWQFWRVGPIEAPLEEMQVALLKYGLQYFQQYPDLHSVVNQVDVRFHHRTRHDILSELEHSCFDYYRGNYEKATERVNYGLSLIDANQELSDIKLKWREIASRLLDHYGHKEGITDNK